MLTPRIQIILWQGTLVMIPLTLRKHLARFTPASSLPDREALPEVEPILALQMKTFSLLPVLFGTCRRSQPTKLFVHGVMWALPI